MVFTSPIWMPRYLTLASLSITRPARGEVTVTVSVDVKAAVYARYVNTGAATRIAARIAAAIRTWLRFASRSAIVWHLPGEVEVAGRAVDGERDEQRDGDHEDQRGAHRLTHPDTDADRPAGCVVAVG